MKQIKTIFKDKDYLLDEPEIEQLVEYCEQLLDQIVEFKFEKSKDKQLVMLDMIKEIVKACDDIQKQQTEFVRFGLEPPDFEAGIRNLRSYIFDSCRINKIKL
ncbi:MAG: hypothetical protein RLZZ312_1769 [Bacteroidota bacterium]|jgi:hypothetical protein